MANDKTKIIRESVDVFIAPKGTDTATAASWTILGWCEAETIKLTSSGRNEIELHDNSKFKISNEFLFEALGLETDQAKITALEGFEDQDVDILLIKRADRTAGYKLDGLTLIVEPDFVFSNKTPKKVKISATRTAQSLSDFLSEVTGLSGY
jgi:hypothetical protein